MFSLDYDVRGTGWAYLTVTDGSVVRRMELSYIGPDINDLVWATVDLLVNRKESRIVFETEPGEHVWTITPLADDVKVIIRSEVSHLIDFDSDTWTDEEWTFEAVMPAREFGRAVLVAFERMLADLGVDGYKAKWLHEPFAITRIELLRSLVIP